MAIPPSVQGLSGVLEDVSVVDLLQFLHVSGRTGTLELTDEEETFYVVFYDGEIIHAATPERMNVGRLLVSEGLVAEDDVQWALARQREGSDRRLGQLLVEDGRLERRRLSEVLRGQIEESLRHVVSWQRGDFNFYLEDEIPVDDVRVSLNELPAFSEMNTQFLLVEALRLFDKPPAKKRPRPSVAPAEDEFVEERTETDTFTPRVCLVSGSAELIRALSGIARSRGWELETPNRLQDAQAWIEQTLPTIPSTLLIHAPVLGSEPDSRESLTTWLRERLESGVTFHTLALEPGSPDGAADLYACGVDVVLDAPELDLLPGSSPRWRQLLAVCKRFSGRPRGVFTAEAEVRRLEEGILDATATHVQKIRDAAGDPAVGRVFLDAVTDHFDRAVLLLRLGADLFVGGAFGSDREGKPLAKSLSGMLRFAIPKGGVVQRALREHHPIILQMEEMGFPDKLTRLLARPDGEARQGCLLPLVGVDSVLGLLYCDLERKEPIPELALDGLRILASCGSLGIELAMLRQRKRPAADEPERPAADERKGPTADD